MIDVSSIPKLKYLVIKHLFWKWLKKQLTTYLFFEINNSTEQKS